MEKAPVALKQVAPVYPTDLRALGVQGKVVVDVLIDAQGRVTDARVVRASHPRLGERAVEAARQWTFQPAEAGGTAVATRLQVPFEFVMPQLVAAYD